MSDVDGSYRVLSPVGTSKIGRSPLTAPLTAPLADLSGKTVCAMRRTFRADETFPMIEALLKERYDNLTFIPNWEMPDLRVATAADELLLAKLLHDKGCDVLLTGNAA
jgi:hypothetical protein